MRGELDSQRSYAPKPGTGRDHQSMKNLHFVYKCNTRDNRFTRHSTLGSRPGLLQPELGCQPGAAAEPLLPTAKPPGRLSE